MLADRLTRAPVPMTLPAVREHGGVVDARDEAEMVESAVESLRRRLPGRSDADLQAIVDQELTRVHLRALLAEKPDEPTSDDRGHFGRGPGIDS